MDLDDANLIQRLSCGHYLHKECITQMRRHGMTECCPLCKQPCQELRSMETLLHEGTVILERVQRPINGEHMMMDAGWTSHVEQRRRGSAGVRTSASLEEQLEEAVAVLEEARLIEPTAKVLHSLGVAKSLQCDFNTGAQYITEAMMMEDNDISHTRSQAEISKAQSFFVSSGHFVARVSYAFMLLGQEKFSEADEALKDLAGYPVQDDVQLSVIYDRLGVSRALERRFVEALEYFQKAVKLDPNNRVAIEHVKMANVHVQALRVFPMPASSGLMQVPVTAQRSTSWAATWQGVQKRAPAITMGCLMQVVERLRSRTSQKRCDNPSMVEYFRAVGLPHRAGIGHTQVQVLPLA